ncbi:MAG: DMT family transporter [Chitinophagaceae bacterium]|nr:DMT family transporter [Chitinophagaceae bacterium]
MSKKFISWAIYIALCIIWGSSFKLMHDSQQGLSAAQMAALRIFSAGLVFVPLAFFHFSKIPKNKLGLVLLSAVVGNLIPAFLFAEAITRLDSSLAGILNSLTPICVVLIGIFFFKDKVKSQKIVGVVIGFLGLVLLTVLPLLLSKKSMSFDNLGYTLLIVLATFLYGINVNMVGHYLKGLNPIQVATVSLSFMTIPAGIILIQQGFLDLNFRDIQVQNSVWASVGLGIGGSAIATALFYLLVQKAGILFASLVTYGIPFIALLWGFIDGEKITFVKPLCLGIILMGVYMANRPDKKEKGID